MKKSSMFGNACSLAALGLSPLALAGEETAAVEAESSNPWTLEASLLYLEARSETYNDQGFEPGYRLSLGYQADGSSWGYRLRLMDHEGNRNGKFGQPGVQSFELEGIQELSLGEWDGSWSLGLRYLEFEVDTSFPPVQVDYEGLGPVIGADLVLDLNEDYGIYVSGRASYIFGEDDADNAVDNSTVLEAGIGLQRSLDLGDYGGYVRLGLETHRYYGLDRRGEEADLLGGVLSFGFNF